MARNMTSTQKREYWLLAILAIMLIGCETTSPPSAAEPVAVIAPEAVEPSPEIVAEPGLSADERLRKVMRKLELGEVAEARVELDAYLVERPDSKVAADLLRQIDVPPEEYYPAESFNVRLTPGDSLSTLAQKYLGTYYQFYGLAKYNSITQPGTLTVGQIVRIPLTESARLARQKPSGSDQTVAYPETSAVQQPPQPTLNGWPAVSNLVLQNNYQAAVAKLEASSTPPSTAQELYLAVHAYTSNGAALAAANPELAARQYLKAAQLLENAEKTDEAYKSVQRSVQLDGDNAAADNLLQSLKVKLADDYHKQASTAFRRQALDEAIALWDKVLEIDPDHQYAISYRLQAIELKKKLSNLQ